MKNTDKPARQMTKLTDALRDKESEIAKLTEKLAQSMQDVVQRSLHGADLQDDRDQWRARCLAAETRVVELDGLNTRAASALDALDVEFKASTELIEAQRELIGKLDANWDAVAHALGLAPGGNDRGGICDAIAIHRESTRRLAELAPQTALLDEQRVALNHILDSVRARMRRKELEEERAVLNRRALATATPGRNAR